MNWQQIAIIIWEAMILGIGLVEHGKPRTGKNNFWISLASVATMVAILYTGGFWK